MEPLISILVTSIPQRQSLLSRLLYVLEPQVGENAEVIIYQDDCIAPLGDKTNALAQAARGRYVVVVDDDDLVTNDYVETVTRFYYNYILDEKNKAPDFIGYKITALKNGSFWFDIVHSPEFIGAWGWENRGVSPKCLIKREIFQNNPFPNGFGGDVRWAHALEDSGSIKGGAYIDRALYIYDFYERLTLGPEPHSETFNASINSQRDVGFYPFNKEKFIWI